MLRFGPFTLDATTGELRRDGRLVPLAPQPFRLLLALASRPGELVTREELRQQVWGDGTFVDFERGLNFCVLQARTALGDDAKEPQYIETLPRRGYRFVAAVASGLECGDRSHRFDSQPREPWLSAGKAVTAVTALQTLALIVFLLGGAWIAKGLLVEPRPEESLTARTPAAHEAYLRGRQLWSEGTTPELSPGYQEAYHCLEDAYLLSGDYASALAARKLRDPSVTATDARKFFEADRIAAVSRIEARNPYGAAVACALASDRENALLWLRRAKEARNLSFPLAGLDPKLAILHGDARYVELLAGSGLRPLTLRSR